MVVIDSNYEFSCSPCSVWVTGYNDHGQLGTGHTDAVEGFQNVADTCFEEIHLKLWTTLGKLRNNTYWAGW